MKTYLRIFRFAGNLNLRAPLYVFLTVLGILFNIANFSFLIPLLKVIFESGDPNLQPVELGGFPDFELSEAFFKELIDYVRAFLMAGNTDKMVLIKRICIALLGSVFLANLFTYLANVTLLQIKRKVILNIRGNLYKKIIDLHLGYFSNERKGDMMSRMTNDVQEIETTAVSSFNILMKEPLTIMILFTVLFSIHWQLTLYSLLILPLSGGVIGEITRRLRKKARQGQESLGTILGVIDETMVGQRVIKAFSASKYMVSKYGKLNLRYSRILYSMDTKKALASPLSQFMGVGVVSIFLYLGATYIFSDDPSVKLEPAGFLTFIILYAQIIAPLKSISNAFTIIQRGLISAKRVFEVLDTPSEIVSKPGAVRKQAFHEAIELHDVVFKYDEEPVLKGISLKIEKGKTVALVGPSGGGKSTLMDLIIRFYDPQEGAITIDGEDLRDCDLDELHRLMGVVTQDAILFNDTVHNNIAFGIRASREEVVQAAKIANADEFIQNLDNGYDSEIGDQGLKLSGGQRQRLTIARAVLANPPILLLDEATSALDSESEHLVQEALTNLMKNRTSIVIAHRFSTIQHADEIIVLKQGQIVERGSHEELMAQEGLYMKLNQMQAV